jgi:uncharacterized YigZ family protein
VAYQTVAKQHQRTEVIKASRFIAVVSQLESLEHVAEALKAIRLEYPEANHYCYAYKLADTMKFSDDGEPAGTAGRPMLEVIQKRGLDHILAIVIRYFGGTKLGAGGLVRAYSGSLAKALDEAGTVEVKDKETLSFEVPFALVDSVHRFLDSWPLLEKEAVDFTTRGMQVKVTLLADDTERFSARLGDVSRGQIGWLSKS